MMKYQERADFSFFLDKNHFMYDYREDPSSLHIFVKSRLHSCRCPQCGMESDQLHATYERIFQDTPIHCKQTFLHTNVYKYDCVNPACSRKVFMEALPFAKASQVRTDALNQLILGVSIFMSNEGASKVLSLLGVHVSNDTIQRLYDRIAFADDPDIEGIGVDDVALRKGQTYSTTIYDLKSHHLIALLEGRDGKAFKEWLENHDKVRLVARDRASAYAAAISEVLPECLQVADRYHLFENLLEPLAGIFRAAVPAQIYIRDGKVLDQAPEMIRQEKKPDEAVLDSLHYDNTPPLNPDGTQRMYENKKRDLASKEYQEGAEKRKKKRRLVCQVREHWGNPEKKTLKKVADAFGISAATVKRYVNMSEAEIEGLDKPVDYPKRHSPMNDWLNVIFKMMCDGHSSEIIYYYIQRQAGFQGKKGTLGQYIYLIGKNNFPNRKLFNTKYMADLVYPPDVTVISRSALLKYVLTCNPKTKKDPKIEKYIDIIKEQYPAIGRVEDIFKEFHSLVMGTEPDKLDGFLEKYGDGELESFCNGIRKDILSVKNAIGRPESSGFVEGGNNKFKLIKRIVYGRSGLVNLGKKCKLAFMSASETFRLSSLI